MQDIRQTEQFFSHDQSAAALDQQPDFGDAPVVIDERLLGQIGGGVASPNNTW